MEDEILDEKSLIISRGIGIGLIILGIYGLVYAYKTYKGN